MWTGLDSPGLRAVAIRARFRDIRAQLSTELDLLPTRHICMTGFNEHLCLRRDEVCFFTPVNSVDEPVRVNGNIGRRMGTYGAIYRS